MPGCTTKLAGNRYPESSIKRKVTFAKLILSSSAGNCGRETQPFSRDSRDATTSQEAGSAKVPAIRKDYSFGAIAALPRLPP
jgi:hypothetical protein